MKPVLSSAPLLSVVFRLILNEKIDTAKIEFVPLDFPFIDIVSYSIFVKYSSRFAGGPFCLGFKTRMQVTCRQSQLPPGNYLQ